MRFLVVLCVIAALAAPSLGESPPAPENPPESVQVQPEAAAAAPPAEQPAEQPAPAAAENPAPEAEKVEETNVPVPDIAKPLVDPTPAPGEEPVVVEVPAPHRPSLSNFFHSLYDRFSLPSFHWPSLWPFRRGYPLRDSYPPRGRYPPEYPPVYIVRENEPMNEDYY